MIPQRKPHNTNNHQPNYNSNQPQNHYQIQKQVQNNQHFVSVNNQNINYVPGTNQVQFVNLSLTPYDLSTLSNDEKEKLKKHNLGKTITPITVLFGIFAILGSWFFGISVFIWSCFISFRHYTIFSKLPQTQREKRLNTSLGFLFWIPLLNFLIIPYLQDRTRRKLNLQYSLRNKPLPFSRNSIKSAAVLQSISILFVIPLIVFGTSFESVRDDDVPIFSLLWHIPIIIISIGTLIYLVISTNDSKLGWWPSKAGESKTSRDLIESSYIPLLITIISVFFMMVIILPIYGGNCRWDCYRTDDLVYEMQMWIFFPTLLTLFFGLLFKQDLTTTEIKTNRSGIYILYTVLLCLIAIIPFVFIVLVWISMLLMLVALITILSNEILINKAINVLSFDDQISNSWTPMKPQPHVHSIPTPKQNNAYAHNVQKQIQQQFQRRIQANPINELTNTRNRFTKNQLFASGGMAKVYYCTDNSNGEVSVWKQAQGTHIPLHDANKRLKYEAEVLMGANHPRIPAYLGFTDIKNEEGKDANVVIMEYLEGGDLKSTVTQIAKVGLIMPAETIINYLKEMCEPLIHMSSFDEPIYHRDLKPHNIIIHPTRGPVIIDWGLAKAVQGGSDISVTRGGSGTWTSPERDSGISGPFTDVYSLGKILYYLATCKQPPAIVSNMEKEEMVSLGHPEWLAELMLKAAWPRHQERVQNVSEFFQLLENEGETKPKTDFSDLIDLDDNATWG